MNLAWILLFLPLASAIIIHLFLKKQAGLAALFGTVATLGAVVCTFLLEKNATVKPINWLTIADFNVQIGIKLDQLSIGMMFVVTLIGVLVHIFSLGYMKKDQAKARYFGNLSLFMFSMTGIVLSSNFVMTFIFWELVGLSSYLLIGHWYQKDSAANAAKKAFLTNRIGDFGFMIGILMLWGLTGQIAFDGINEFFSASHAKLLVPSIGVLGSAIFMIFLGAMGKSAQAPLHVWLPDAMEGPTPVSALIHAATMVAAGVYMMARLFTSIGMETITALGNDLWSLDAIAWIGAITSALAALMATQQNDIKKILAYSTLSQLGYMVMAVGLAQPDAGMFHLYTHAWFKALLFLGSGAVIYACHHQQDIWKMGGLFRRMPLTALTFAFGTLSLTAFPFTAGFFSKEGILYAAKGTPLFWIAVGVAFLTTFYMFRLFFVVFMGKARSDDAKDAKEVPLVMLLPLFILTVVSAASAWLPQLWPVIDTSHVHVSLKLDFSSSVLIASLISFVAGVLVSVLFYFNRKKDPINIPLFRNAFYIDQLYSMVVKIFQDILAAIIQFIDEFIIGSLIVEGSALSVHGIGGWFRKSFQSGNLQRYAFLFSLGIILTIYFTVFY